MSLRGTLLDPGGVALTPVSTPARSIAALDPSRPVTQALFRPATAGDISGPTRTLVDVFGANYRANEVLQAMSMSPPRAGVVTEAGTTTSSWPDVVNNRALTGLFIWTGVDYLGEADDRWPNVQGTSGLLDAVGTPRPIGLSWQRVWGAPATAAPATGTTASRVTLAADHTTVSTDVNDVSYVKATIADTAGRVVTGSSAPVTFAISGPGSSWRWTAAARCRRPSAAGCATPIRAWRSPSSGPPDPGPSP